MIRLITLIIKITALTAAAVWLANRPGEVVIHWQGYEVSTTVAVLALLVVFITAVGVIIYSVWRTLVGIPGAWGFASLNRRKQKGYLALTQGLVAVAAGDAYAAQRFAKKAEKLLNEPPLTLLLQAQAAQLDGDDEAAAKYFNIMLERQEMAFLGVRGLLTQSIKKGDDASALQLARRAYVQQPKSEWVLSALLDLELRAANWEAANTVLTAAAKQGAVTSDRAKRLRTVLALAQNQPRKAYETSPTFAPAVVTYAAELTKKDKRRAARKIIERAWAEVPHPMLAVAYLATDPEATPLAKVTLLKNLKSKNPNAPEGNLAFGEAALLAHLWGEAKAALTAAWEKSPTALSAELLAKLAEAEGKTPHEWRAKAASAASGPVWSCMSCHHHTTEWATTCAQCQSFATLNWLSPTTSLALLPVNKAH
jgi:HemY protein